MSTYPNESWPADAAVEALDGTTHPETGLPFIAKGTGPTSVPTYEVQYNRLQARLYAILAGWRQGMVVREGALKIGVYPIAYTQGGGRKGFLGATDVDVPDDALRMVYLDEAATLRVEPGWPPDITSYLPLAIVDTTGSEMLIQDQRVLTAFHVPSLEAGAAEDRRVVTAHRGHVGSNESDTQVFAFDPPEDLTLHEVQVYCGQVSATASVDVKAGGSSVLSAAATPVAGSVVKPAVAQGSVDAADLVTVHVTTDGAGTIDDLTVTLLLAAPVTA